MIKLNTSFPVVDNTGKAEQSFRLWATQVETALPVIGEGSPEGKIYSPQFSLYIDKLGSTGAIEYRKMSTDIAGDTTKGWVLV